MNRIFKKVWNKRRGIFVAVSEAVIASCLGATCEVAVGASYVSLDHGYSINGTETYDRLVHLNGDLIVNGTLNAPSLGLDSSRNHGDYPFDHLIINSGGTVNITETLVQEPHSGSSNIISNNGILSLNNNATLVWDGMYSNDFYLEGSGTINGGALTFNETIKAHQETVQNFSSLILNNSVLDVVNLNGNEFNIGAGSTLSATNAVINSGTNSGNANFGNTTVNNAMANYGNLTVTGALNFGSAGRLTSTGTLTTSHTNVFSSLGSRGNYVLNVIGLSAQSPERIESIENQLFQYYVKGSISQNLANHATFSGGKVIVTGVNITTTQRDDLINAFKEQFFRVFAI